MSTPDTRNNEPDAYTALLNHFTQKNTDAIVKCAFALQPSPFSPFPSPFSSPPLPLSPLRSRPLKYS